MEVASESRSPSAEAQRDRAPVTVRCWGVRGSIPTPGPETVRYGGNTTCVEVRAGDTRLIFDAGSGIRILGQDLVERGPNKINIFLTHFHWDHIQGFPFFAPLYDADDTIRVIAPRQSNIDVRNLFAGQMGPIYFPVPFSVVAAAMEFEHLQEGPISLDGATLQTLKMKHPSNVVGYRVELGSQIVCFLPDNELDGDMYRVDSDWDARLLDFVRGADLLIHDAMYTEEEYTHRAGWGHSTFKQAIRLAEAADVSRLLFFHHDPRRSDDELDQIVDRLVEDAQARGSALDLSAAREGMDLRLEGGK